MKILILNGPNLNRLGMRKPEIYGRRTMAQILLDIQQRWPDVHFVYRQSNHEGDLIDWIQSVNDEMSAAKPLNDEPKAEEPKKAEESKQEEPKARKQINLHRKFIWVRRNVSVKNPRIDLKLKIKMFISLFMPGMLWLITYIGKKKRERIHAEKFHI